ncbi:MAG TPA: EI24 domain-containing protein [Phaeodactylibacter sp.]|nr:EI24 domain-containing protein [Phaeodactylibacter sp.]
MTPLSQKIEQQLLGQIGTDNGFQLSKAIKEIIRGLRISLRNIFFEIMWTAPLFILGLIPALSFFTTILMFLIQAYYAGFGNMDYTLERHLDVKESIRFVRKNRGLAIGLGTVFLLLLSTGIGFLVAPPLATAAATLSTSKRLHKKVR